MYSTLHNAPMVAAQMFLVLVAAGPVRAETPVVFPSLTWDECGPEDAGMDPAKLDLFATRVGGDGVVIREGFLVKSWGDPASPGDWASAAKPVLSTLLLLAVAEGSLTAVDVPVARAGWPLSEKDMTMTFRHLANMVSGYACPEPPGAAYGYNDLAIELYARSLECVFGEPLDDAIRVRLHDLSFEDGAIFGSRCGRGVRASPRDFARVGWLWLNEGRWEGRQLIPLNLVRDCVRPGVPSDLPRTSGRGTDYLAIGSYGGGRNQTAYGPGTYGFNFWFNQPVPGSGARVWPALPADAYQANGMWNRDTVTVIPSLQMVVAVRGAELGRFEPGRAEGEANRNLGLLVEACSTSPGG